MRKTAGIRGSRPAGRMTFAGTLRLGAVLATLAGAAFGLCLVAALIITLKRRERRTGADDFLSDKNDWGM